MSYPEFFLYAMFVMGACAGTVGAMFLYTLAAAIVFLSRKH